MGTTKVWLDKIGIAGTTAFKSERAAIVVGINEYKSSKIQSLEAAEVDAYEICEVLRRNGNFVISENHLLLGPDATRKKIFNALGEIFLKQNFQRELIVIYFAGNAIIDTKGTSYIAPYDMDPDDPFIDIKMNTLRNVISISKNEASVIIFLDCCIAGIAAKGTTMGGQYAMMDNPEKRNMYASQLKNMIEPPKQSSNLQVERGKIILSSIEEDCTVRDKKECMHSGREDLHPHGTFSFHLIEGLDGKAADPDTGVITIGSVRRYIEDQMKNERKQIPVYHIADASRIDNIKLAISQEIIKAKIGEIINSAEKFVAVRSGELADIQSFG